MPKVILLPLEPIDMRYTIQWRKWFVEELDRLGIDYIVVDGDVLRNEIKHGFVLDAFATNYWKMTQMANFIRLWDAGEIKNGDVVIDMDIWHPGLEAIPYIEAITKTRLRYCGFLHAGSYDITDFTYRVGMRPWGRKLEEAWFMRVDEIFVASSYHKDMVLRCFGELVDGKIHVTGLPLKSEEISSHGKFVSGLRDNEVIFTSRLDPEKRPELAEEICRGAKLFMTHKHKLPKAEYYKKIASCKVSLSTAIHENGGIGIMESMCLGTVPVVPDALSYVDYVPSHLRYRSLDEAREMIEKYLSVDWEKGEDRFGLKKFVEKYDYSVRRMIEIALDGV